MKDTVNFRKEIIYPVTQVISLPGQIKAESGGGKRGGGVYERLCPDSLFLAHK